MQSLQARIESQLLAIKHPSTTSRNRCKHASKHKLLAFVASTHRNITSCNCKHTSHHDFLQSLQVRIQTERLAIVASTHPSTISCNHFKHASNHKTSCKRCRHAFKHNFLQSSQVHIQLQLLAAIASTHPSLTLAVLQAHAAIQTFHSHYKHISTDRNSLAIVASTHSSTNLTIITRLAY